MAGRKNKDKSPQGLRKCHTGIKGLDEILYGGLPAGRTTLVCGNAGSGKSLLGIEFLLHGVEEHGEGAVLLSFDESEEELVANAASLGMDLRSAIDSGKLVVDYIEFDNDTVETLGDYNLDGLFVRMRMAVEQVGARRLLIDSPEALFDNRHGQRMLRAELRRLYRWLKDQNISAIVTAERGAETMTRIGFEDYLTDCVLLLSQELTDEISTRHLQVVKYRGSAHGTNRYPFLIDHSGLAVVPITSLELNHKAPRKRLSSGIEGLDELLAGKGFFRGSSILVSGAAGTGKSSLGLSILQAACARGERALYCSFEESADQVARNMRSIGMRIDKLITQQQLMVKSVRPSRWGLESHLIGIEQHIEQHDPQVVVLDPISSLGSIGAFHELQAMLTRLIDFLKSRQVTCVMTALLHNEQDTQQEVTGVSSLMDAWLHLQHYEADNERRRLLRIVKVRGLKHSTSTQEFQITSKGLRVLPFQKPGKAG